MPTGITNSTGKNGRFKDMSGKFFGALRVVRQIGKVGSEALWECACECGKTSNVSGSNLRKGKTKSCGCLRKAANKLRATNGSRNHPEYTVWSSMLDRCHRKRCSQYPNYGGRGIKVCERWASFSNFLDDMGPRPPGMMIERIDNNGDYDPANCKWVTPLEQANNRRTNRHVTANGKTQTVAMFVREYGLNYRKAYYCLKIGKTPTEVIQLCKA